MQTACRNDRNELNKWSESDKFCLENGWSNPQRKLHIELKKASLRVTINPWIASKTEKHFNSWRNRYRNY